MKSNVCNKTFTFTHNCSGIYIIQFSERIVKDVHISESNCFKSLTLPIISGSFSVIQSSWEEEMSGEMLFKTICILLSIFYKVEGGGCECIHLCLSQGSGRKTNSTFKAQRFLFIQGQIQFDHRDQRKDMTYQHLQDFK